MDQNNGLLPFGFSYNSSNERNALNTDPRDKHVIDENASSMYHTRGSQPKLTRTAPLSHNTASENGTGGSVSKSRPKGPTLLAPPSIKRKMGESFTEKDNIKRREQDFFTGAQSTFHDSSPTRNTTVTSDATTEFTDPTDQDMLDSGPIPYPEKQTCQLPSSPPVFQPSEYDVSANDYTVPDSPVRSSQFKVLPTSPVRATSSFAVQNQSSEPDFGIDSFNRYKPSQLSFSAATDPEDAAVTTSESQSARARNIILDSFENMTPAISLEGMNLTDIPEEVQDLDNLVIFDIDRPTQVSYQLYLTNNKLSTISPALFKFTKLNVLSLRQNLIKHLPGLIGQLKNLTDLNISINKLSYLPPQILDLPSLLTFRAGPNPYLPIPEDAVKVAETGTDDNNKLRYISPVRRLQRKRFVPSLKALCLHEIANYDVTYRETKAWKKTTPKIFHPVIATAITKGKFKETCNNCRLVVVEPYAEVFEWWDILQNVNIPVRRVFCCDQCVLRYETEISETVKAS